MPLPGDGTCEWDGWVPMERHAREVDPDRGYVSSSNNAISDAWADGDPTNDGLPHYQSWFKPGWRFNRVRELLEETRGAHSLDDTIRIQSDDRANPAPTIVPALLEAADEDPGRLNPWAASLVDALVDWEYTCPTGLDGPFADSPYSTDPVETRESIGCLAFHAALVFVGRAAVLDELEEYLPDEELYNEDVGGPFLHRALSAPESLFTGEAIWDDVGTPRETETRNQTIRQGLNAAGSNLDMLLDDEPDDWRWGRLHTTTFMSWIQMDELDIGPYANDGAENSVDRGDIDFGATGFAHIWGPIMRIATELTPEGPRSWLNIPAGLTSDTESRYYNTMTELWLENEAVRVPFTVDEAEASAVEIVTFRP
jgi:penicillin amidase